MCEQKSTLFHLSKPGPSMPHHGTAIAIIAVAANITTTSTLMLIMIYIYTYGQTYLPQARGAGRHICH